MPNDGTPTATPSADSSTEEKSNTVASQPEQTFVADFIDQISDLFDFANGGSELESHPSIPAPDVESNESFDGEPPATANPSVKASTLNNLIWVYPEGGQRFETATLFNNISKFNNNKPYNFKRDLDSLTPLQLSCITPLINLYRRDYYSSDTKKPDYKDRIFVFNNDFNGRGGGSLASYSDSDENQIINFLFGSAANPTLQSAGIKNVNITFAGTNPAESERSIDVSITLLFSSFEALLGGVVGGSVEKSLISRENGAVKDATDYTDTSGLHKEIKGVTRNYLSLITYPPSKEQVEAPITKADIYLPNLFSVFLETSWKLSISDKESLEQIFPSAKYFNFIEALSSDKLSLRVLLNLVNHELNFTEEGSVELKINYIGSLDTYGKSTETDFLYANYKRLLDSNLKINSENQAKLDLINEYVETCYKKQDTEDKQQIEKQKDELSQKIKDENKEKEAVETTAMNQLHQEFMRYLIDKQIVNMKVLTLDEKAVVDWNATIFTTSRPTDLENENFVLASINRVKNSSSDVAKAGNSAYQQTSEQTQQTREVMSSHNNLAFSRESEIEDVDEFVKNRKIEDDAYNIVVIPLGTLLDGFLTYLKETLPSEFNKHLFFILGDFTYQIRNTNKTKNIPLAKLPIPLTSFQQWYMDAIIRPEKKNFTLFDFLDSFFKDLVIPTLKGQAPAESTIGNDYAYSMIPKQAQILVDNQTIESLNSPFEITRARVLTQDLVSKINNTTTSTTYQIKTCNIIFFSIDAAKSTNDGREFKSIEIDQNDGISHFWVGNSIGLIKSIKFKRVEQQGLKEAKSTKEAFIPLNQLRDLYNADITMYGNHYYSPGQKIFIHPQNSVLGEPFVKNSLSNIMGIGGYYDIIKVTTNIGDGGYETTLDCVWHNSGEGQVDDASAIQSRCSELKSELSLRNSTTTTENNEQSEP